MDRPAGVESLTLFFVDRKARFLDLFNFFFGEWECGLRQDLSNEWWVHVHISRRHIDLRLCGLYSSKDDRSFFVCGVCMYVCGCGTPLATALVFGPLARWGWNCGETRFVAHVASWQIQPRDGFFLASRRRGASHNCWYEVFPPVDVARVTSRTIWCKSFFCFVFVFVVRKRGMTWWQHNPFKTILHPHVWTDINENPRNPSNKKRGKGSDTHTPRLPEIAYMTQEGVC